MKRFIQILVTLLIIPLVGKTQSLYVGSGATVYVNRNGSSTTTPILSVTGAIQNNGTLTDAGSITATTTFANNSILTVNIGGTTLGTSYDQLAIAGAATIAGTLTVNFVNSYTPSSGSTFIIVDAGTLTGTFSTMNLPTLASGMSWSTSYNGAAGTVILSVSSSVLPVELLDFKATLAPLPPEGEMRAVRLDWATALETNTKDFVLERSRDGKDFTPLSKTDAKGSHSTYTYLDEKPFNGVNYYRLKINDLDNEITYSKIVSAIVGGKTFKIKVYPSLVSDVLTIMTDGGAIAGFEVVNMAGQTVLTKTEGRTEGSIVSVNLSDLPRAVYMVRARNTEGVVSVTKIVKQ